MSTLGPEKYWGVDYAQRVPYHIHWIDQRFGSFLDKVYGNRKKFLDQVASVVSIKPTNETAKSHPTGGRVFVYDLVKPYPDVDFDLACLEVDVKGVLLTDSGYRTYHDDLSDPQPRREIHHHKTRKDLFGPLCLGEPDADKDNTKLARGNGILTHIPGAILVPDKLVYDGKSVSPKDLINLFKLPQDSIFALYVRVYPLTSTRSSDLINWPEQPCNLPSIWIDDKSIYESGLCIGQDNFVNLVKLARATWLQVEKPRLMKAMNLKDSKKFDDLYFQYAYQMAVSQVAQMVLAGISPASGEESDNQTLHHTHFQNKTSIGAEIEWTPITSIGRLKTVARSKHLIKLLVDYHEHIINIGLVSQKDWTRIPTFDRFLRDVLEMTGANSDIESIYKLMCTDNEAPQDGQKHVVIIHRLMPDTERKLENAILLNHLI